MPSQQALVAPGTFTDTVCQNKQVVKLKLGALVQQLGYPNHAAHPSHAHPKSTGFGALHYHVNSITSATTSLVQLYKMRG